MPRLLLLAVILSPAVLASLPLPALLASPRRQPSVATLPHQPSITTLLSLPAFRHQPSSPAFCDLQPSVASLPRQPSVHHQPSVASPPHQPSSHLQPSSPAAFRHQPSVISLPSLAFLVSFPRQSSSSPVFLATLRRHPSLTCLLRYPSLLTLHSPHGSCWYRLQLSVCCISSGVFQHHNICVCTISIEPSL